VDDRGIAIRFRARVKYISLYFYHGSGAQLAPHPVGAGRSLPENKAAAGINLTPQLHLVLRLSMPVCVPPLRHMHVWSGA
jgi:hypothetical protein